MLLLVIFNILKLGKLAMLLFSKFCKVLMRLVLLFRCRMFSFERLVRFLVVVGLLGLVQQFFICRVINLVSWFSFVGKLVVSLLVLQEIWILLICLLLQIMFGQLGVVIGQGLLLFQLRVVFQLQLLCRVFMICRLGLLSWVRVGRWRVQQKNMDSRLV